MIRITIRLKIQRSESLLKQLQRKINDLDNQPIQKYGMITGRYTDKDIVYNLYNVYGGTVKKCSAEIEIPKSRLFEDIYVESDMTAIASYIIREFYVNVRIKNDELRQSDQNKQKGYFCVYHTGQRVIPNNMVTIDEDAARIKLEIKLPINATALDGKLLAMSARVASKQLSRRKKDVISAKSLGILLMKNLPELVESFIENFSESDLLCAVKLYRNQEYIRDYLKSRRLVSFIGNGSILPRKGGSDFKNPRGAKAFMSPKTFEIEIKLPDDSVISGMGIKEGITVILGDAYQGKSTLLSAIYEGIYDHITGDGREYVITCESALNIKAENGRGVQKTDISFYLKDVPESICDAVNFTTVCASGSTSQAAAVTEAVESGCELMLFDEDNCANNFMYKEKRLREIFGKSSTVPFLDNARSFYSKLGISSIFAVGASAEYLDIADCAVVIRDYEVYEFSDYERVDYDERTIKLRPRVVDWASIRRPEVINSISILDSRTLKLGYETIDVGNIIPNVSTGQMDFIACVLKKLITYYSTGGKSLRAAIEMCYAGIERNGGVLEAISSSDYFEYVRKYDIEQILYRCKSMRFR